MDFIEETGEGILNIIEHSDSGDLMSPNPFLQRSCSLAILQAWEIKGSQIAGAPSDCISAEPFLGSVGVLVTQRCSWCVDEIGLPRFRKLMNWTGIHSIYKEKHVVPSRIIPLNSLIPLQGLYDLISPDALCIIGVLSQDRAQVGWPD